MPQNLLEHWYEQINRHLNLRYFVPDERRDPSEGEKDMQRGDSKRQKTDVRENGRHSFSASSDVLSNMNGQWKRSDGSSIESSRKRSSWAGDDATTGVAESPPSSSSSTTRY